MGLDMYIFGRRIPVPATAPAKPHPKYHEAMTNFAVEFSGEQQELELAYWRKHPNLHGYIVKTYAGGVDDCNEVPLNLEAIEDIIKASQNPEGLPETSGFFFGTSDGTEKDDDLAQLEKVKAWLVENDPEHHRAVYYGASW